MHPKKDTIIGSYLILNDWFIWSETKNANQKIFIINFSSNIIKEIDFFKEPIKSLSISTYEKNKKSNYIYISYSSPKSPNKVFLYNIKTEKKNDHWTHLSIFNIEGGAITKKTRPLSC